jgi:hypothetical protein
MEEERGFNVEDKRRFNAEGEPVEEAVTEAPESEQQAASDEKQGEMPTGDVYSLIGLSIMMLSEAAWQWMGLRVNPALGRVEKDINQAKIAIDSVIFLSDKIESHLSEDDKRSVKALIKDLQLNFVQQANKTD